MDTNILNTGSKKEILVIVAVILLLIILSTGAYFYWINYKKPVTQNFLENDSNAAEDITNSATKGVLPSIQTNPLEDKPDINPADKANPFEYIIINPF